MPNVNRRDFFRLSGAAIAATWFRPAEPEEPPSGPLGLGRVTEWRIWAYNAARPGARQEHALQRDEVLDLYGSADTEGLLSHNPRWFLTKYGWVYSSWVQPVQRNYHPVVKTVPKSGFWAEVTVPYVVMRAAPNKEARQLYRLYYSSVHLVIDHLVDVSGADWYQLQDDQNPAKPEFVRAAGLRRIDPAELTPISPRVKDKRLEVSLYDQVVRAYENDELVREIRCATGARFVVDGVGLQDFTTPVGEHTVVRKRPSRHMLGFIDRADEYDLPGVPFCTYFTQAGVAVHGAYWHNDFGHPRSHGCVNVLAAEAKWVYRWSQPAIAYEETVRHVDEGGTPVHVSAV
jgi:lipoprotein-anchoring transpeptidase ErfK/SrfK